MSGLDTSQLNTDEVSLKQGGETEAAAALEKDMAERAEREAAARKARPTD